MKWLNGYIMRLILTGFVAAIVLGGGQVKGDFNWAQKTDMPTPRWNFATSVVNGKIYAIGGESSEDDWWSTLSAMEEYDPASDTWTKKVDMPIQRSCFAASVVDGKIYAIGGDSSSAMVRVEMYDPATDTWTRKADMPTPRYLLASCTVNGKIYAIGGTSLGDYSGLATVEEYDPATNTWTRKADMPLAVYMLRANTVRGKIYALGGRRPDLKSRPYLQEYDPTTDTWTRKSDMLVATSQMASVVLDDKIVVIGGWLWSANFPYTTVQIYDPETDIWTTEADTPFLKAAFSAEVVRGRIFAIGGTNKPHPCPATSTVYECDTGFIPNLCDFNSDHKVDKADMHIMVDHWGENYNLCDIDPPPFGDGIVDIHDFIVLTEHLYRLTAHWQLDETDGSIAYDSFGDYDGTINGNPSWLPTGGIKGGSLMLDGMDDYVDISFVLNPGKGSFSVFAWVYCWMPGQVIISQKGEFGGTWLGTNPLDGKLMTGFSDISFGTLVSEAVITDIQWHHVGFVYDMDTFHRRLYVDGVLVAEDTTVVSGVPSDDGLYIGASKDLGAGTLFSGFIDDVRIYNQALIAEEIAALVR